MSALETVFHIGDDTLGVTLGSKTRRNALANTLRQSGRWLEVVPGAEGITVQYDPIDIDPEIARAKLQATLASTVRPDEPPRAELVIPVCYEAGFALDMAHISNVTGLTQQEIITRHTRARQHVDMIGFTPGFAYLEGGDPALNVARLETPRAHLPAGAIGLAGGLCGLYALPGPGGWPIIGRTPMPLFDTSLTDPFRLEAGQTIRFEAISSAQFESWVS